MTSLQVACLILTALCFGFFTLSVWFVFVPNSVSNHEISRLKIAAIVSIVIDIAALVSADPPNYLRGIISLTLLAVALLVFVYCSGIIAPRKLTLAFSADVPQSLLQVGPYRFIRHPFYTSYLTAYAAVALATLNPITLLPLFAMGLIYTRAARYEENKFLTSPLRADYQAYARSTGRFLPRLTPWWPF